MSRSVCGEDCCLRVCCQFGALECVAHRVLDELVGARKKNAVSWAGTLVPHHGHKAGRGPLAGPVVTAAVILDPARPIAGLGDSKALTARRREALAREIRDKAWVGIGIAEPAEIDRLNILHATMTAMARAVTRLPVRPDRVLIDGNRVPDGLPCPAEAIVLHHAPATSEVKTVHSLTFHTVSRPVPTAHGVM